MAGEVATETSPASTTRRRAVKWLGFLGVPVLAVALLVAFWNWDWFIPLAESRASAAIGRQVTIQHLHLQLGRVTRVVAEGVRIDNPPGFPATEPFARADRLTALVEIGPLLRHRRLVIPAIDLQHPVVAALATEDGRDNYTLDFGKPAASGGTSASTTRIGDVTIEDGQVHAVIPRLRADFTLAVSTRKAEGAAARQGQRAQIAIDAKGTYAGQPVTGTLVGGALLSLRDTAHPYPVELHLANGDTHVALSGTVQDPLAFKGADIKLDLAGSNMADLYKLTGIPIPETPKYHVTGQLDYAANRIRFRDIEGVVGNSDLEGSIAEDPGAARADGRARPDVTMQLASRRVDLADLGGFIGTNPGGKDEKGATPQQRQKVAKAEAHGSALLPESKFNLPKLQSADIHLKYRAARIEGRSMPFDRLAVDMDIVNGAIALHPVSFGIGAGRMEGEIALTPQAEGQIRAKADVRFQRVDVSRLMEATHAFHGAGSIGGRATLDSTGDSIASWAANGNGGISLYMSGGDLSALLVDLSGLEFGNALLSALGMPKRTNVECLIADFALQRGILQTRTLLLDTGEAILSGTGDVDLRNQTIEYRLLTKAKHFSIGSLPAPIDVTGPLKKPAIGPDVKQLGARGGIAAALGVLAAPLALLPTIQFGVDDPHKCGALLQRSKTSAEEGHPGRPRGR